jgi:hypothetical protein
MLFLVVCGLSVVIAIFSPRIALSKVDLPTLGLPTIPTKLVFIQSSCSYSLKPIGKSSSSVLMLIFSLSVNFVKDNATGKCYLELWEDEAKLYWERLSNYGVNDNYNFEKRNALPEISLKELDLLFEDFLEYKEQLLPTKERFNAWLKSQGVNPEAYLVEKLKRINNDVKNKKMQ